MWQEARIVHAPKRRYLEGRTVWVKGPPTVRPSWSLDDGHPVPPMLLYESNLTAPDTVHVLLDASVLELLSNFADEIPHPTWSIFCEQARANAAKGQ